MSRTKSIARQAVTAAALALWLGNRRSDVATLRWDNFDWKRDVVRLQEGADLGRAVRHGVAPGHGRRLQRSTVLRCPGPRRPGWCRRVKSA